MASDNDLKCFKTENTLEISKEGDSDKVDLCVLCCSEVELDQKAGDINGGTEVGLLLKNLTVIFLLKKVLQVPDAHLEKNLRVCGNPDSWLILCRECNELSRRAKELHLQIVKTARALRKTEQFILDKVKGSLSSLKTECQVPVSLEEDDDDQPITKIWRLTRKLVTNYNYRNQCSFINPFIKGDKLAEKHLKKQRRPPMTRKVEGEPFEGDNYDTIWEEAEMKFDEPDERMDEDTFYKPAPSSIPKKSTRSSRRKQPTKSTSATKITVPTKPRLKRNQIPRVKIYGKFKCNFCEKLFATLCACYTHEREKHPEIPDQFPCDLCSKIYNSGRMLNFHKKQTHKIKLDGTPYIYKPNKVYRRTPKICNICGKSVTHIEQHHRLVHEKKVQDFCHVCGKGFSKTSNWRHHLLSMHKDDPVTLKMKAEGLNLWRCQITGCNAVFIKKISWQKHIESRHRNNLGEGEGEGGVKPFVCETCGKGFWKKDKLRRHELIHLKQKQINN